MENIKCIVHYRHEAKYSNLKKLSSTNKDRIKEAKSKRERFSGALHHKEQCEQIPSEFVDESHGVHLEPCYKKYKDSIHNLLFIRKCQVESYNLY